MDETKEKQALNRYRLIVIAVCLVCLFTSLGSARFWDQDEGFFAGTAAEMYGRGDWVVPYFNGELFGHKPPLMYWMMMTGYRVFGIGEFGARFFPAVFGLATALLTFRLGQQMFNSRVGLFAGLVMPSCLMFSVVARAATPDAFLVFFSTLALYLFATRGFLKQCKPVPAEQPTAQMLPATWSTWAWIYGVMGLAALVKGPIGFLFPMAVIGLFLLFMNPGKSLSTDASKLARFIWTLRRFGPVNFLRMVWLMRPLTALGIILLVAGPWFLLVGIMTDGAFLTEFFGVHHWQRFTTPMDNHSGPIFYYLVAILIGIFPWSIYGGPAALEWIRQLRKRNEHFPALVFLGCWVGVYVGLFSLASTKLPNYVLPAYPALAVIVGLFIDSALRGVDRKSANSTGLAFGGMVLVGGIMVVVLPLLANWRFGGQTLLERAELVDTTQILLGRLALIGVPLIVGGVLALWFSRTGRMRPAFLSASFASVAFIVIFWNDSVPFADQYQTPQEIAKRFRQLSADDQNASLAHFDLFRPSMVFYGGGPIQQCNTAKDVINFLSSNDSGSCVVTTSDRYADMDLLHDQFEIVARQPDFPKRGELLLLRGKVLTADHRSNLQR